ncbi:uncharacterized protein LOC143298630 [Babylonia areolata]|uniref:uncharacterized protein LOC143298630 n=1 Tax=Babylonia areolata TaxID=304850 RepID=UPI003FD09389
MARRQRCLVISDKFVLLKRFLVTGAQRHSSAAEQPPSRKRGIGENGAHLCRTPFHAASVDDLVPQELVFIPTRRPTSADDLPAYSSVGHDGRIQRKNNLSLSLSLWSPECYVTVTVVLTLCASSNPVFFLSPTRLN